MLHSYKGGSGKTLFSTNIAQVLMNVYNKRVLLIESDFAMPSFQIIFDNHKPDIFFNDYLNSKEISIEEIIYPNIDSDFGIIFCKEDFNPKDKVHSNDQAWFYEKLLQLKSDIAKLNYDFIIFDTSPGLHLFTINILTMTDYILLLMRPDSVSYRSLNFLLENIYGKSINLKGSKSFDLRVIINQVPKLDLFLEIIKRWKTELSIKYEFIDSIEEFEFDETTSYYSAIEQYILPDEVKTRIQIMNYIRDKFVDN